MAADLYTVLMLYQGGSYIAQVWANSPDHALREWAAQFEVEVVPGLGPVSKQRIIEEVADEFRRPVAILETDGVYYTSMLVRGDLMMINLIRTKATSS